MSKFLSLEELKKNSSGNGTKKQNTYKGSTPLLSLDELKNNEGPSVETASIGNTVEVYNKYKQAKSAKPSGMVGPAGGLMTERKIEIPVTPISARKQTTTPLPTFRDDAHRNLYKNSLQTQAKGYEQEVNKHLTGWRANAITTDPKLTEANKKLSDVRKQLEQIGKLEQAETYGQKYLDGQYNDNFIGQTKANYAVGRMGQDSSMAWNAYLNNPTEANRKYAERIDEVMQKFREANAETLADDATLPWLSQSFAQYVPQLIDQTKAGAAGALGGGVVGSVVPVAGTLSGMRAGAVAATGMQSYDLMRGAAFKSLIDAGVDEETALRAASDEALISSLVEMGDTAVDIMTLGSLSALKGGIAGAFKTAAGTSAKKKAMLALANYGINIGSEGLEEAVQEAVSIGNARRTANGDMSLNGLVGNSIGVAGDAITGRDADARESIFGAAKEGAKISAVMAGADAVVSRTGEVFRKYLDAKYSKPETSENASDTQNALETEQLNTTTEQLNTTTEQLNRTAPQNPVTVRETAISEELNNSPAEMRTQPAEAQTKPQAKTQTTAVNKKSVETPMTAKFLANEFHGEGRKVVQEKLNETGNTKVIEQAMPFYTGALSGQSFESIRNKYATTATTDYDYAKAVFDAGLADREADVVARMKGRGKFAKSKGVILGDVAITESQMALANYVSKTGGMTVRVVDTMDNYNGEYDRGKNEIVIALDSQHGFAATLFHETVHFIKAANAEGYQKLQDTVFRMAAKLEGKPVEVFMKEYKQNWERNDSRVYGAFDVMEEMTADAMMKIASDESGMKELVNALKDENPTVLEQLKEFLDKLLQALESLVKDGRFAEFTEAIHKDIENTRELRKLFTEELMAAGEYAKANEGDFLSEDSPKNGVIRYSVKSMADAAGLEAKKNPMTGVVTFELNGKPVKEVTAEHIRDNSGLGALIRVAEDAGNITEAEADIQYKAMAEIINMIINTQDPDLVWAWVGSSLFSAVKTNSDPQYGTTIDFTTVCRKTQDMITAMSKAMIKLGRGLTTEEVTELQQKLIAEDSAVPCPVCYVFSRWAGVGSILDNMRRWQEKYDGYSEERLQDRIAELTEKLGKGKTKDLRKMLKEQDERYFELEREKEAGAYRKKKLKEERKTADAVGKASIDEQIKVIDERAKKIKKELDRIKSSAAPELSWLLNVRTNPGYAKEGKVPNSILFNLDGAATFSEMYPLAWKYRSTRGPGAGKAILPYSDMRLGDMILGVKNNSANGNKLFANAKGELSKEQMAAVEKATARTKAQNLIGGQRFQSTSDFRYDYALDYLLAFMECQALGSKIQTYTKIIEYVDMIAAVGGDVNMSVMPKDKGYVETEDGKKLIFSSVTGIDFEAAKVANKMHDNAQLILVGINDEHIRLALDDFGSTNGEHIGFVIPYHASGASINEFIRVLVGNLGEEFRLENYVDYSDVQTDSERKNATPDQKRRALIRKGILQGRLGGKSWTPGEEELKPIRGKSVDISGRSFDDLRAVEQKALRGDKAAIKEYESWSAGVLWDVYNKLWVNEGHPDFGVRLSSAQAGPVMPHEYWNKGVNRDKAYVNGFIFRSYCYSLGLAPRFTGAGAKGKAHGDFSGSKGYWKTLIDRPMYNNDGTYRDQQKVNVSKFQKEMLTEDYAEANWGDYKVQEPDAKRAERAADKFVAEKQGKKFSVRENGEAELLRENKELKKANENLRGIFNVIGRQRITETSAKEVATAWLKNIGSSYDKDEFARKFKIIAEHMADARNEYEAEDAVEAMKNLAMEAMRKSEEVDTAAWEENKDLYNKVKSTKLFVSDNVAEDLKAYGGYASVVRDTYGKMDLSRKADKGVTDIDVLYGELNAENELLFPYEEGMTKADMLMNIADGMESLQPVMKNKYGYTAEEMAEDVVYDLFDRMGDLTYRTSSLESDLKSNEKYTQLKAEYEKRIAKVRREAEQQREKYESDAEARYARLKDRHKEQRINREMKKARETVERESKRLLTWLTGGTDKNHVPENMRVAVEKILTSITTKDARINQLQLIALKDVYGEHGPEGESGDYLEYDPDVTAILKEFTKQDKYKDGIIVLDDLSLEEMQNLSKMIRSLKHTIQKANKWMGLQRDLNVAEICDNQAFEWDNVKDATTYGAVRQLHKYFGMSMADANVFFKEFGKVAHETVWRGLRTAFDKKINFLAEAEEFSKGIDQKQVAKWRAMPPQKFELPSGDIWLTPTQVMSLYCLAKREDAKRHLYGGGMKAAAFKFMWKLGAKFPKEAMKQYAGRRVTEADINAITATLTDEQKATADKIQKFMVEHCAKWGNATSMLMFGYMKFGDPNYFPIRVDGDTLTSSVGDPQLRIKSIQNTGAAMPIDERAKNALVLEDIFSVLASHVEEMSSYAAFVPALSDLNKFVNYKVRNENGEIIFAMKTAIGQKVGPDAMGYIYDLLETLNGSPRAAKEGILPKTLVRNAKTASVAANLRVIAQQPTAYLRAGIVLDMKYLLQGMTPGKVDKEEVFKYCPIARWKSMGNYDMNIGKTVEQLVTGQTLYQKIIDKSMAGAGWADSATWGWIWKACKAETADKYPELKGEELLIKAGERMSEVIDDTQVVDSPLHRSQMMRNKSLYMQMITSYMSEPTKAVGLVASTVIECRKNPTKENKKKVMRTWRYLIATGVLTAAFAGVADMFRDDDEDEEMWEKFLQAFWGDQINAETPKDRAVALLGSNIGDNLNPLNSLPLMRDVLSMLQGYEITRTDFAWMADIMNNIGKWNKYLSGESEYTLTALLGNTAQSLSKVTGMPIKSAARELDSVRRAVVGHMSGDVQYQNAKITYSIGSEKNISRYVSMMLEARMNGDKTLAKKIYNEMIKAGIDNETIDNKIDSVSKKALESEPEVANGAEAYREGDYDALIGAIDLLNKKGYSEKNAADAITKAYNKKYGEEEGEELTYDEITESYWDEELEESPADYQMMENAFMYGSMSDYNEMWNVLELDGKKEANMKSTMKKRLRKIYHEAGTSSSDKVRIEKEFTRLGGKLKTLYEKP